MPTEAAVASCEQGSTWGVRHNARRGSHHRRADYLWARDPPIRYRAKIPTSWIELTLHEGKNRQVRRMTARVGFPTLRLVRAAIGKVHVKDLPLGEWREIAPDAPWIGA